jgi:hypothetical protein
MGAGGLTAWGTLPAPRANSGRMKTVNHDKLGTMGAMNKPKITNNFVHQGGIKSLGNSNRRGGK